MYKRIFAVYAVIIAFCAVMTVMLWMRSGGIEEMTVYKPIGSNIFSTHISDIRGCIYDYNLRPLVGEGVEWGVLIEPQYFKTQEKKTSLLSLFGPLEGLEGKRPFCIILKSYPPQVSGITAIKLARRYENGMAEHIIGYTDKSGVSGLSGIEKAFDSYLNTGESINAKYYADASGGSISGLGISVDYPDQTGQKGIRLTLDYDIQKIAQQACDDKMEKGAAVVIEVKTGYIKAIVSKPGFDQEQVEKYLSSQDGELLNRAFLPYSLGSVFKTVVAACAIEQGKDENTTTYVCNGFIDAGGVKFPCIKKEGHGELNMTQAFGVSCNPYFINLANMCGIENVVEMAKKFGFSKGQLFCSGVESSSGNMPDVSKYMPPASVANTAIGQGEILATPLQVASMMCTVANGGVYNKPVLLYSKVSDGLSDIELLFDTESYRVISEQTAQKLQNMLRYVVTDGTGKPGEIEGIGSAGKTSSAEAGEDVVHGWFAGYFPYDSPKYAVCVFAEDGKSGGKSAAPIFKQIGEQMAAKGLL